MRRARTNTPLQALTWLNDPDFCEAARAMAGRMAKKAVTPHAHSHRLRLPTDGSRTPTDAELERIASLLPRPRKYDGAAEGSRPSGMEAEKGFPTPPSPHLDHGLERTAKHRRNHHKGVTTCRTTTHSQGLARSHPAPLLPTSRFRDRSRRANNLFSIPMLIPATARITRLAPKPPMFPAEGQERHLPVHGRRAVAVGSVRLQAQAQPIRRPDRSAKTWSRASALRSSRARPGCSARRMLSRGMAESGAEIVICCRISEIRTKSPSSSRCGRRSSTTRRRRSTCPPDTRSWAGPSFGAWTTYGSAARTRICPDSSCCSPARASPMAARLLGQRLSAHRLPGSRVPAQRRPGPVPLESRRVSSRRSAARRWTFSRLNETIRRTSAIRKSPPGSTPTRWRTACKPACRS